MAEPTLQIDHALVLITGNLRPDASGYCAWCRVAVSAQEFGISVSYDPLVMGKCRGG